MGIAVVHSVPEAHLLGIRRGRVKHLRRAFDRNPIRWEPAQMTPFNMIGVSYVVAIALLTVAAMAV